MLLLKEKLNQQHWNSVYVSNHMHEAHDSFMGVSHGLLYKCFSIQNIYNTVENSKKGKSWITHESKKHVKMKQNILK